MQRTALLSLLAVLVAFTLMRGVLPAMTRIDTDFPNYLTAAKIVAEHGEVSRLYDAAWFQEQMRRYAVGVQFRGKFAPFTPPTALLLVPLAGLKPLQALRVLTVVSVLCLAAAGLLLARSVGWTRLEAASFVLLSGLAITNALRDGQPYIIVSFLCVAGYHAWLRGRPLLAGVCFGLFTPIKLFPVVFLLYFAFRRENKLVAAAVLTAAVVSLLSILVLGWQIHGEYLRAVLGNHLVGELRGQNPFAASFQSFDSLLRRLFEFDATQNPHPLWDAPRLRVLLLVSIKTSILALGLLAVRALHRRDPAQATAPALGIIGVTALLLAPATASYHFTLWWLPLALLIAYDLKQGFRARGLGLLVLYIAVASFPSAWFSRFEGEAALSLLAYPRLLLTCVAFGLAIASAAPRVSH